MKTDLYYIQNLTKNTIKINVYKIKTQHIKILNKKYKKQNKATDILSFTSENKSTNELYIYNNEIKKKHIKKLIIHGTLHILEYTHYKSLDNAIMTALEKIIGMSGIEPPTITTSK